MRTHVEIDDQLVAEGLRLTGLKTKRALVEAALRQLIQLRQRKRLTDLAGKVEFATGYDYKALRSELP